MTLIEALQDIGKGRIIDNGCNYELIALAKGTYSFYFWRLEKSFDITLTGKQGENAREIQKAFYQFCTDNHLSFHEIHSADYKK